jgi:hypothetical protein
VEYHYTYNIPKTLFSFARTNVPVMFGLVAMKCILSLALKHFERYYKSYQ